MKFKRVISTVLVMCMLLTVFPSVVFAEQEESGPTVLEAAHISELTTEEMGEGVIYAGTQGGDAEERGQYIVTLFRDGYCDEEATVELHTVDVSAKIGVDYQIIGEDTVYTGIEDTVMERNANYDANESIQQFENEIDEIQESLQEEESENSGEPVVKEKSSLARIKEEQTGIETRDIIEKDEEQTSNMAESVVKMITPVQKEMGSMLNEYTAKNLGEFIESSSVSLITFEPGETEKQVIIEVYEDEEPETDEIIYLFLSGAEGALLGDLTSVTIKIIDDEEKEDIFVGLSDEYYRFDDGEDSIVLVRTGAVYEMVSVDVRLEDGSVQTVMFKPYETEKQIPITVSGSGVVDVALENFKGCKEGEITEASVLFGESRDIKLLSDVSEKYGADNDISLMATTRSDKVSFVLTTVKGTNGYDLRVDYVPNQKDEYGNLYAKIMDTGRNPEVHIGNYYFSSNFSFGYTGYGDPSERDAYHGYNGKNIAEEPGGYAYLHWYDWRTWKKGTSYACLSNVNHRLYQYYGVDWHQTRDAFGGQISRFKVFPKGGFTKVSEETTVTVESDFGRRLTTYTSLGKNNLPQGEGGYLEAHAEDSQDNKTPVITAYVYGMAAFFREFDIGLNQPAKMNFKVSGNKTEGRTPANVALGDGHSLRYTGQSLAIKQNSAYQSGIIPGELIGYKIETSPGTSEKSVFYYMAYGKTPEMAVGGYKGTYYNAPKSTNMESICFDKDFITNKIDKNLNKVSGSGTDWSTRLTFTPIYQFKDATVQIISNSKGEFKDLSATTYYDYHVGDTLTLEGNATDEAYVFAGYKVTGRATTNTNETPLIDQTVWSDDGSQLTLLLGEKNCTYYQIEPVFKKRQGNYIIIDDKTSGNIKVDNLLTQNELRILKDAYPDYEFDENQKIFIADSSATGNTEAERILNSITVRAGEIYHIYAHEKVYDQFLRTKEKPTFYNKYFSSHKITSNVFDYIASDELTENIIELDSSSRLESDEIYMTLKGTIQSTEYSLRQSAATMESTGIENLSVKAGDRGYIDMWATVNGTMQKISQLERATNITDWEGNFVVSGVLANKNDTITMYYSNGDTEGVRIIRLSELTDKNVMSDGLVMFKTTVANWDKTNSEEIRQEDGKIYDLNQSSNKYYSEITTPVFTQDSPYPVSVDYTYLSGSNTEQFGTSGNAIAIMEDNLTLKLVIDRQGHQISKVVFTVDKQNSADQTYVVEGKINQDVYTCDFDGKMMNNIFEAGDRIYVTLYDADQREVTFISTDENGNEITVTSKEDIVYNKIFTGLSLYVPMIDVVPQVFKVPDSVSTDVPVLGKMMGSATSGTAAFSVQKWETTEGLSGMSLVLDANINAWNKNGQTTPAQDLLTKVKEMKNEAQETAMTSFADKAATDKTYGVEDLMSDTASRKYFDSLYEKSIAETFSKIKMNLNFIVLLNFDFAYSKDQGRYLYTGGQVVFGGSFAVAYTFYTVIYGVPLYMQLSGNVALQLQANYGENTSLDYDTFQEYENITDIVDDGNTDVGLFMKVAFKSAPGIGICGVIGARGVIKIEARTFISFMHYDNNSGIVGAIQGGIGVDLVMLSFEYTVGYQIGAGIYENSTGWLLSDDDADFKLDSIRVYSSGGTGQVGGETVQENGYELLLDDAPERTKPHVVGLNDGRKLLVYIGANPDRALDINKHCLYYSIYENGHWSEAQVIDEDGTADATPTVEQYGDKVIVAWADAVREFTADEVDGGKYKEILADFDISASIFDTETSAFGEVMKVSDDAKNYGDERFLDYAPVISADKNGEKGAVILYIKKDVLSTGTDNELIDSTAVYETIALSVINSDREVIKEQYLAIDGDPLMFNLDSAMEVLEVNGEKHAFAICTYVTDRDNDLSDSSDWDVYLLLHDITADKTYAPINLCNDFVSDSTPKLTRINGSVSLTYVTHKENTDGTMVNVFNSMSVSDMLDVMQYGTKAEDGSRGLNIDMGDILYDENPNDDIPWYHKTAAQLGLTDEQYAESIFAELYEDKFPIKTTEMRIDDNQSVAVNNYQITEGKDGKVYLLWIDNGSTELDDYSIELYGAVNNVNAEEGERSGWSKPVKLTNFSDYIENSVIDEFSVAVDKNGEFTLVSNMYSQNFIDGEVEYLPNKLIAFTLDESGVLTFSDDEVSFDTKYPKAGEETEISFTVKNDGLQAIDVNQAVISVDGNEDVTVDINETIFGGESRKVSTAVKMPETIDDTTAVTVTVTSEDGQTAVIATPIPCGAALGFDTKSVISNEDGTYSYVVEITNHGNKASGEFNIDVQRVVSGEGLEGKVTQMSAKSIDAGETAKYTVKLDSGTLSENDFNDLGLTQLNIKAVQSGTELSGSVKRISSAMVKSADEAANDDDNKADDKTPTGDRKPASGIGNGSANNNSKEDESVKLIMPFTDVMTDAWYYDSVKYVYENGIFKGTSNTTFEPESPVTRGMFVTVLGRYEGIEEAETADMPFTDVKADEYYASHIKWAAENGIVNGYGDGCFGPDDVITREQMAAVMYRYSEYKEKDLSVGEDTNILSYEDYAEISEYAVPAIQYAVGSGLMKGKSESELDPQGILTRAEMAAIMMRYSL